MPSYGYPEDGKLHTRYSELVRCTPGSIGRVIGERLGALAPFETPYIFTGTHRHREFQEEMELTGRIPAIFAEIVGSDLEIDATERQFSCEIFKGVVLHSTLDCYKAGDFIGDFKLVTAKEGSEDLAFSKPPCRQTAIYAIQLELNKISIRRSIFFYEIWAKYRTEILGYRFYESPVTEEMKNLAWEWLENRVQNLILALQAQEME